MRNNRSFLREASLSVVAATTIVSLLMPTLALANDCPSCEQYLHWSVGGHGSADHAGNAMSMQSVIDRCGPIPGSGKKGADGGNASMFAGKSGTNHASGDGGAGAGDQGVDPNFKSGDDDWNNCFGQWVAHWAELGQYCDAIHEADQAHDLQEAAAILYTIAATLCTISCIAQLATVTYAWGKGLEITCTILSGAAGIYDIGATIAMNDDFDSAMTGWGTAAGLSGAATSALATAGGAVKSGWQQGSTANKAMACVSAGMTIIAAALKWGSLGGMADSSKDNCTKAGTLLSKSEQVDTTASPSPTPEKKTYKVSTLHPLTTTPIVVGPGGTGKFTYSPYMKAFLDDPWNPKYAYATAGPMAPLLSAMPKDKVDEFLHHDGASAKDIADRLRSGQSPASVAASIAEAPPEVADVLKGIEKDTNSGKLSLPGMGGATSGAFSSKSGGAGAPAKDAKPNPFAMLGMKGPGGLAGEGAKETTFEKAKRELAAGTDSNGDIWHEGFGGTIFQIVSGKLDKTRERVEQLEWETPLNRALVGLPAKKAGAVPKLNGGR